MRLTGKFEFDLVGSGATRPMLGGVGHGGRPLVEGNLRVEGRLEGGALRFLGANPQPGWEDSIVDAVPTAETAARAEEARRELVARVLAHDEEMKKAGLLSAKMVVHLAKGTTYDKPPFGAVAFIGGGSWSHLVWLGVSVGGVWYPISGVRARSQGPNTWSEAMSASDLQQTFEGASLLDVRRDPRGVREAVFGTCAVS